MREHSTHFCPPEHLQGSFWYRKAWHFHRGAFPMCTCVYWTAEAKGTLEGHKSSPPTSALPPGKEASVMLFPAVSVLCLLGGSVSYPLFLFSLLPNLSHSLLFSFLWYIFFFFFKLPSCGTKVNFINSIHQKFHFSHLQYIYTPSSIMIHCTI